MFKSIFGATLPTDPDGNQKYVKSLDLVIDDIKAKKNLASAEDKQTLERWLASYEELHAKFDSSAISAAAASVCDTKKPTMPAEGLDAAIQSALFANYDTICKANMDIMLAAMECGARRVCTLMMMSETTKIGSWDKVVATEDLHSEAGLSVTLNDMKRDKHVSMAHYGKDGSSMETYMRLVTVNNYFMRKYAYMINQLKARQMENDSLAICSYSFRCGNHTGGNNDFPILVAGKAAGFKTGFHHRVITQTPENAWGSGTGKCKPLGNLWSSVLKKLYGIKYNVNANGDVDSMFG